MISSLQLSTLGLNNLLRVSPNSSQVDVCYFLSPQPVFNQSSTLPTVMVSFHIWGEHQSKTGLSKRNNRHDEKLFYRKLGLEKLVCRRVRIENSRLHRLPKIPRSTSLLHPREKQLNLCPLFQQSL